MACSGHIPATPQPGILSSGSPSFREQDEEVLLASGEPARPRISRLVFDLRLSTASSCRKATLARCAGNLPFLGYHHLGRSNLDAVQ